MKKFWDRYSIVYDLLIGNSENNKELMNYLKKQLNKEDKLIEVACGTGIFSTELSPHLKEITACDYSKNMISKTENKIKSKNIKNIKTSIQDINNLKYENNEFDIALAANILHLLDNPEIAIKELKRVVKNQGLLILPTYICKEATIIQKYLIKLFNLFSYTSNEWTEKEYIDFLKENGLEIVDYKIFRLREVECVAIVRNNY